MHGYSQPSEYRFSHDSIELAQRAAECVREFQKRGRSSLRVLDLCAGCGVVGLEFLKETTKHGEGLIEAVDFVEVQDIYRPHFTANASWVGAPEKLSFRNLNYEEMLTGDQAEQYDLVVSNPPYFDRTQGNLPPSDFKARCRFFVDSDFTTMWRAIAHVLKPQGEALILVRDLRDHGVDRAAELDVVLAGLGEWRTLEPVRGTQLVWFQRR